MVTCCVNAKKFIEQLGSGCGSDGRVVASNNTGPQFESNSGYYLYTVNCFENTKIKRKRPGIAHFLKKTIGWTTLYTYLLLQKSTVSTYGKQGSSTYTQELRVCLGQIGIIYLYSRAPCLPRPNKDHLLILKSSVSTYGKQVTSTYTKYLGRIGKVQAL